MSNESLPEKITSIFSRTQQEGYKFLLKTEEKKKTLQEHSEEVDEVLSRTFRREHIHSQMMGLKRSRKTAGFYQYSMSFRNLSTPFRPTFSLITTCACAGFDETQIKTLNVRRYSGLYLVDIFTTENIDPEDLSGNSKPLY